MECLGEMKRVLQLLLHLAVVISLLSHLVYASNAATLPGVRAMEGSRLSPASRAMTQKVYEEKTEFVRVGRMEYELNDYPGSGANDRHTPSRT